jgi:leucyl aminopeptidase
MQFEFVSKSLLEISSDVLIVFAGQTKKKEKSEFKALNSFNTLDKSLNGALLKAVKSSDFEGKRGETLSFFPESKGLSDWIIIVGLGELEKIELDDVRRVAGKVIRSIHGKVKALTLEIPLSEIGLSLDLSSQMFTEGIILGDYAFKKYKSEKEKKELSTVIFNTADITKTKAGSNLGRIYSEATIVARDLVNEQSALVTPSYLADYAKSIAKKDSGIKCKIIEKDEAKKLGMEAFLGVARASSTPPKFIHLEYTPPKISGKEKLALVGKGITFDSGGMNVKPGDYMKDMKMDMSGAAVVLGIFSVISDIRPKYPVMGLIAATPNMISGDALVPGDVVKAMNGKTIEILNTDAEGRVTMADSLSYAVENKATTIIDIATLTGAVMVALGPDITGLFSNDKKLKDDLLSSAQKAGEKMWELPLDEDYKEMNNSDVADISNLPNSIFGGSVTAALFLQEFVEDTKWAHLDIAGSAFITKPSDISQKGATGHGVRTILNYLKS